MAQVSNMTVQVTVCRMRAEGIGDFIDANAQRLAAELGVNQELAARVVAGVVMEHLAAEPVRSGDAENRTRAGLSGFLANWLDRGRKHGGLAGGLHRIGWRLRQLVPCRYQCHGRCGVTGKPFHAEWFMWFGRVFGERWWWCGEHGWQRPMGNKQ